jgi:cytidyltransferase-like protein
MRSTDLRNLVWEGRFQPIHRGHVAYVQRLLERADTLTVVVVANELSSSLPPERLVVPDFSREVDEHHAAERNPWPLWVRHELVHRTLAAEAGDRVVTVLAGHRIDLDWPMWDQLLRPGRIFAVPERDSFEDAKAKAWTSLDQRVERVAVADLPRFSGTQVRDCLATGGSLSRLMHPVSIEILTEHGFLPAGGSA